MTMVINEKSHICGIFYFHFKGITSIVRASMYDE